MRIAILMVILLSTCSLYGQLHLFGVLPSPNKSHSTIHISHSMGEPMVQRQAIFPYLITEGFQQGEAKPVVADIQDALSGTISFTPNPVSDLLQVRWENPTWEEIELIVSNTEGKAVIRQRIIDRPGIVNMSNVIPGTYVIQCFDRAGKQIVQQKIVKI